MRIVKYDLYSNNVHLSTVSALTDAIEWVGQHENSEYVVRLEDREKGLSTEQQAQRDKRINKINTITKAID